VSARERTAARGRQALSAAARQRERDARRVHRRSARSITPEIERRAPLSSSPRSLADARRRPFNSFLDDAHFSPRSTDLVVLSRRYDEEEILRELPQALRSEVVMSINRDIIEKVDFLTELGHDCVTMLVPKFRPLLISPDETVVREGLFGREMYLCSEGYLVMTMSAFADGAREIAIGKGDYFAECVSCRSIGSGRSRARRGLCRSPVRPFVRPSVCLFVRLNARSSVRLFLRRRARWSAG